MFGKVLEVPQNEKTPFYPRSPYGVSKVYAHWITVNYREAHNIFACNGILFNHESPIRGETFVTKKIVSALCKIKKKKQKKLFLGNLNAKRDWGHARDYVLAMWKMLQMKKPDDYVISTGKQYSIKEFANLVMLELGIKFSWKGNGINAKCYDNNGNCIIECDKAYFRPLEVDTLLGDSSKARKILKWKPKLNLFDCDVNAAQLRSIETLHLFHHRFYMYFVTLHLHLYVVVYVCLLYTSPSPRD